MLSYTNNWFDKHIPILTELLKEFIGQEVRILEIGCYEGRSTVWFLENMLTNPYSSIVCVDPWDGKLSPHLKRDWSTIEKRFYENIRKFDKYRITNHKTTSRFYFKKIIRSYDRFDIIRIDGAHSAKDTLFDIINSWERLSKDGILVVDDYKWNPPADWTFRGRPKEAIDLFLAIVCDELELLYLDEQAIIRKIT